MFWVNLEDMDGGDLGTDLNRQGWYNETQTT